MNEVIYVLFCTLSVLQVGDVVTTNRVLARGGREANPIMAWVMARLGGYWWLSKVAIILLLGVALWQMPAYPATLILIGLNALYLWVIWHNARQL